MRILIVGDPHGKIPKRIPKNLDLILITGDFGKANFVRQRFFDNMIRERKGFKKLEFTAKDCKISYMEIFNSSLDVLRYLSKFSPTYSILGNVGMDMIYDSNIRLEEKKYNISLPSLRRNIKKIDNFHLVRNRVRIINGLRIGFLEYFKDVCWYKEYGIKDNEQIKKAKKETKKIKNILRNFNDLDILVCHQPPYGFLDKTNNPSAPKEWKGKHAGSKVILDWIRKEKPRYVFCGHIHEAKGKTKIGKTKIFNVGCCGDSFLLNID